MTEYIVRESGYPGTIKQEIVGELVRCKDCIHYENGFCYNPNTYDDEKTRGNTIPNWYCADGERREDGTIQ